MDIALIELDRPDAEYGAKSTDHLPGEAIHRVCGWLGRDPAVMVTIPSASAPPLSQELTGVVNARRQHAANVNSACPSKSAALT